MEMEMRSSGTSLHSQEELQCRPSPKYTRVLTTKLCPGRRSKRAVTKRIGREGDVDKEQGMPRSLYDNKGRKKNKSVCPEDRQLNNQALLESEL